MKTIIKVLPYIALIVALIFVYDFFYENKAFKDQINDLKHDKDSLGVIISNNDKTLLNLNKKLKQTQSNANYYYNKLKTLQNETDNSVDNVYDYDVIQLDSIITNYRHIKRPKN